MRAKSTFKAYLFKNFPGSLGVENLPSSVEDTGSITAPGIKTPHAVGVTAQAPQLEWPTYHNYWVQEL